MKNYYRVMLGRQSVHAPACFSGDFIGVGNETGIELDLSEDIGKSQPEFGQKYRPLWMEKNPGKGKISAGLACSALYAVCIKIREGDLVLCPDGKRNYHVGEVTGPYAYTKDEVFPHLRAVRWLSETIHRDDMSEALQNSTRSTNTAVDISKYQEEIERLLVGPSAPSMVATDAAIEDPNVFALEKHLEDFLVANWESTELGGNYDIFREEGELAGQQYQSDTGPIDILAISKDKKELLVVELKKGRASDAVVGQILRYMGFVQHELAESDQTVRGIIIALEDSLGIRRALSATKGIEFYRYRVSFELLKDES